MSDGRGSAWASRRNRPAAAVGAWRAALLAFAVALGCSLLVAAAHAQPAAIAYPNPGASVPALPTFDGVMRIEPMPDTLNLVDRAHATINALVAPLYDAGDYSLYWAGQINANPPRLILAEWEDVDVKFWEALPLMRIMTGSPMRREVDTAWARRVARSFDPRSKLLLFQIYKPFVRYPHSTKEKADWAAVGEPFVATVLAQGRILGYLATMQRLTRDPGWRRLADDLVAALPAHYRSTAGGDAHYFASGIFNTNGWPGATAPPGPAANSDIAGRMIQGPALHALTTGDKAALAIARGFSNFMMRHAGRFDFASGAFLRDPTAQDEGPMGGPHFMRNTKVLDSIADYVAATIAAGAIDTTARDFLLRSYRWAKASPLVATEIGWFPEFLSPRSISSDYGVVDMISIALKLSLMGLADEWDEVDRWTRNQFAAQQLLDTSWIGRYARLHPHNPACEIRNTSRGCSLVNVARRLYGSWGGWVRPNEFTYQGGAGVMQDSTANAARTLFHLWNAIATRAGDVVTVNLPLNRIGSDVTVKSYIPHNGAIEVVVHDPSVAALRIRVPGWAPRGGIKARRNASAIDASFDGRHVVFKGPFAAGDRVRIDFPVGETRKALMLPSATRIGSKQRFVFTFRGNQVIDVTPKGVRGAFYRRAAQLRGPGRMVEKSGFMPADRTALDIYPRGAAQPAVTGR